MPSGNAREDRADRSSNRRTHFAQRLAELRHEWGCSRSMLALRLGVTLRQLSEWEYAGRFPYYQTIEKISRESGKPPGWWFPTVNP